MNDYLSRVPCGVACDVKCVSSSNVDAVSVCLGSCSHSWPFCDMTCDIMVFTGSSSLGPN